MEEPDHIPLRFSDEPISNRPTWVAGGLVLVLICWMGSGFFSIDPQNRTSMTVEKPDLTAVAVTESTVEQVTQYFVAEGQSAPERATLILSEVAGRVMDVFVDKGDIVQAGQAIARLDVSEATANLESAIQAQDQAQRTFSNAERLLARSSSLASEIREITANDHSGHKDWEKFSSKQVFDVVADPNQQDDFPKWDRAHAKIIRADSAMTKGFVRGYRDKLRSLFQSNLQKF